LIFKQFHLESLGHASYLVGDEKTGSALVVDPRRDVGIYFDTARENNLRVAFVLDTHGHNDYLSGLTELMARQDVEALAFSEADVGYEHTDVKDGDVIEMGDVKVEVIHTPGHTPEHLSLLVSDTAVAAPPILLSGGTLLVGDIGRPDLLGGPDQARGMAATLCRTIQERILFQLDDHVQVFPTHVFGSLCGGSIGTMLSTTIGHEMKTNPVLARITTSEEFVEECIRLDNLPAIPPYWRRMRGQNMAGVAPLGVLSEPPPMLPDQVARALEEGAILVDARSPEAFSFGHIPGAINVPLGSSFSTWAGTVLPERAKVVLVLDGPEQLWDASWQLLRIGYGLPIGWLGGGFVRWQSAGNPIEKLPMIDVEQLKSLVESNAVAVLDVRQPAEWSEGVIPQATLMTGAEVPAHTREVSTDKPLAVICGGGYRSAVIASFLDREDLGLEILQVRGGMTAWNLSGYPVTSGSVSR
jgi:hydroxyacylglutathione hydrolase